MDFISLVRTFVQLVVGLVPGRVVEPIAIMGEEITDNLEAHYQDLMSINQRAADAERDMRQYRERCEGLEIDLAKAMLRPTDVPLSIIKDLISKGYLKHTSIEIRDATLAHYFRTDSKIQAIREYRRITEVGLKDAKDQVEAWIFQNAQTQREDPYAQPIHED